MTILLPSKSRSSALPRYATPRTPDRDTIGPRLVEVCRKLGREPMPWQDDWLQVVGELVVDEETGVTVPAYPEAFATIPRQSGKTAVSEAWMWDRLVAWEAWDAKPQSVVWTAQNGAEARKKFRNEIVPAWRRSSLWRHVAKPRFMAEDTGLTMRNGGILSISNTAPSSGHGSVVDALLMDEIFADSDNRREQAFVPAMGTRHDRQKLVQSTAGDEASVLFPRKQTAGRRAVNEGRTSGIAYLEYSADPTEPGYDPESPATWRKCMPALGYTITERMVRQMFNEMLADEESGGVAEFERAWLNVPNRASRDRVIAERLWLACRDDSAQPSNGVVYAAEVSQDFRHGSIVAADVDGRVAMVWPEPSAFAHGVPDVSSTQLVEAITERTARKGTPVVINTSGPSRYLVELLESRDVDVEKVNVDQWRAACGWAFNQIADAKLAVRGHPGLDLALAGAVKRPSGDSWVWDRRTVDNDVSPLVGLTLAAWFAAADEPLIPIMSF